MANTPLSIGGDDAVEAHRYLAAVNTEKQNAQAAANELELYLKLAPKTKDAERIRLMIKDLRSQALNNPRGIRTSARAARGWVNC